MPKDKGRDGVRDLLFDAVDDTTSLVERTHAAVLARTLRRISMVRPLAPPAQVVGAVVGTHTRLVCSAIRAVNRGTQRVADEIAEALPPPEPAAETPLSSDAAGSAAWLRDQALAVLNGMWGSHLARRDNALAFEMSLRHQGHAVPLEPAALAEAYAPVTPKIAIFVHGLSSTEWCWSYQCAEHYGDAAINFGTKLREDLGYTPMWVRYNTGRHVSENGAGLSELIGEVLAAYPVDVDEIVLVGHSMGGLVIRSAAHHATGADAEWVKRLRYVVCLGSPHLGAPLEKGLNALGGVLSKVEAAGAQVPAELLNARSDGVKDLRYGYTVEEEWRDRDPDAILEDHRVDLPMLDGVGYFFVAATMAKTPDSTLGRLVGDILVRPPSASNVADPEAQRIPFRSGEVLGGMHHLDLTSHPDVYAILRACLEPVVDE